MTARGHLSNRASKRASTANSRTSEPALRAGTRAAVQAAAAARCSAAVGEQTASCAAVSASSVAASPLQGWACITRLRACTCDEQGQPSEEPNHARKLLCPFGSFQMWDWHVCANKRQLRGGAKWSQMSHAAAQSCAPEAAPQCGGRPPLLPLPIRRCRSHRAAGRAIWVHLQPGSAGGEGTAALPMGRLKGRHPRRLAPARLALQGCLGTCAMRPPAASPPARTTFLISRVLKQQRPTDTADRCKEVPIPGTACCHLGRQHVPDDLWPSMEAMGNADAHRRGAGAPRALGGSPQQLGVGGEAGAPGFAVAHPLQQRVRLPCRPLLLCFERRLDCSS